MRIIKASLRRLAALALSAMPEQTKLKALTRELDGARHEALWACEEAKQLRDLANERYAFRQGRIADKVRDAGELDAIR
jgi:hypothetical protein